MTEVVNCSVHLNAPTHVVWNFVTDEANFSTYVATYAGGAAASRVPEVGMQYEWTAGLGPLKLVAIEKIVEWNPSTRVAYQGELARVRFNSSMVLQPDGVDACLLTVSISYSVPARLGGLLVGRILRPVVGIAVALSLRRLARQWG